mgnify:CR=1 FL=1|jgi:hypothetical protein
MLSKYIDARLFIISLALGLFFVYIYQPTPSIIYVYPTPDNVKNLQYKDKVDNCYSFDAIEVKCPDNRDEIFTVPMQSSM